MSKEPDPVAEIEGLTQLALDLRWSWNHAADELWRRLDPKLWELTRNPWVILHTISRNTLRAALDDPAFCGQLESMLQARREALAAPSWFQENHGNASLNCIAYFSMEFMLSEALPIYCGGLGNVAGDQLKAASDLGVPVVGVGLLYQLGYFRQIIDRDGNQQIFTPYNDPGYLPITPVRQSDGEWLRLEVKLPGRPLWLRAWQAQVGRCRLYLLDSNDPANYPAYRGITSELYGGDAELRLRQEMVLGIGGWRLLRGMGLRPQVCHLNEGHAAFVVLDRARDFMEETGQPFEVALAATRGGNLFTTHTAVPAGFDRFSPALMDRYFARYAHTLGLSVPQLLALGRVHPNDVNEAFNMAYLAIRGSGAVNGVSRLHGDVSRTLFAPLFPRWPLDEVPIGHVTNGVHMPSWDSAPADSLWTQACGKSRWLGKQETLCQSIRRVSDEDLWTMRSQARQRLIGYARSRLAEELAMGGAEPRVIEQTSGRLHPDVLTIGFARRFAEYKRPNLLLHDPDRLVRLLTNADRPVQLLLAGKAHPGDAIGHALIRQWHEFIRRPEVRAHVIFLGDYDMLLAEQLVQGVDVWLNTPRRPWEASGTSGMKVLVNGGLNLSELDGWWAEAYAPDVGWAIGDGREHADPQHWDAIEAEQLYARLEQKVTPAFYERDSRGIPTAWVARVRESMARLTPQFSANRTVREYTQRYYLPAAARVDRRCADHGALADTILAADDALRDAWPTLRFGDVSVATQADRHSFEVSIHPGRVAAGAIRVELFANAVDSTGPVTTLAEPVAIEPDAMDPASEWRRYRATAPATRPAADFTFRIVPSAAERSVPLELPLILWQK
ncbi:MAG: alpha-glucan family phosphorylase [Tepidisphaeraceae bacterium]